METKLFELCQELIPGIEIQEKVSLHDKNWFQTGGVARYFCEPKNGQEFAAACRFARDGQFSVFVLGLGANVLISDAGFDGLIIKPALDHIEIVGRSDERMLVRAGAGVSMDRLITFCLSRGISGLEEFSGIPSSVGGAVFINLHYFEFLLSQFLVSACVINAGTGEILNVENDWFDFGYNQSNLHSGDYYLLDATFALRAGTELEIAYAHGRRTEIIRHREKRYPAKGTCGSFFRNFLPHEVQIESQGKKMIFVAYYLDKIGVKGALRVGNAAVSYQHANMLVNLGGATSSDLIALARTMQQKVYNTFGVIPQPECRLVGFDQYPLL